MGKNGDVIFKLGDDEVIRLRGSDGTILLRGHKIETDELLVQSMRAWLAAATGNMVIAGGNFIIGSGLGAENGDGGDLIIDSSPVAGAVKSDDTK